MHSAQAHQPGIQYLLHVSVTPGAVCTMFTKSHAHPFHSSPFHIYAGAKVSRKHLSRKAFVESESRENTRIEYEGNKGILGSRLVWQL